MSQTIIQDIPLNKIISGKQVRERFDDESLAGLTQSLRESGQQEAVHVLPLDGDMYSLLTGGRRLRAARKAGWTSIAAIVENAQREDLTPMEKAKAIDALMTETGWNATQSAAKLGLANGTVSKLLSLLQLPEEIQQRVSAGEVPATAAYQLTGVTNSVEQGELACRVASGELTRDGLTGAIKAAKRKRSEKKQSTRRVQVTAKLGDRESVTVSAPALDLAGFIRILEKLLNDAQKARSDGLALAAMLKRLASGRSVEATESQAV